MQEGERNAFLVRSYLIRYFAVAMLACVGVGLTFAAFFAMRDWEDQKVRSHSHYPLHGLQRIDLGGESQGNGNS